MLLPQADDERSVHMRRGLLLQHLEPADAGLYDCTSREHSYSRVLVRYRLHVIPKDGLQRSHDPNAAGFLGQSGAPHPAPLLPGHRSPWLHPQQLPVRSYKDRQMVGRVDEHCEQLWYREKRRQKLRTLKLKQESRKARVRRNNPPEVPL